MRQRLRAIIAGMVVATLGAALAVVVSAGPAAAACSGTGCDGVDPYDGGCVSTAVTVASADIKAPDGSVIGRVDLRWSNGCQTNWARTVSYIGNQHLIAQVVRESDWRRETEELDGNSLIWSNMVYAPHICAFAGGSVQFNSNATVSVCD